MSNFFDKLSVRQLTKDDLDAIVEIEVGEFERRRVVRRHLERHGRLASDRRVWCRAAPGWA